MQVHVKTPHTNIEIKGEISERLLTLLKDLYGKSVRIQKDELVPYEKSQFYRDMARQRNPASRMRIYRERDGWTQEELGRRLGGIPKQNIYAMEKGKRPIPKDVARKLSKIFKSPVEIFLYED